MPLAATTIKLDAEKLELAKMKGFNISQLCRDAIETSLKLDMGDLSMLKDQLLDIEKQIETLSLEKKLIMSQIKSLETTEVIESHRSEMYTKWKGNLAFMIKHNTIDWNTQKELFKFKTITECKKWLLTKMGKEGLL